MSNATQAAPALPLMDETYYRSRRRRQGLREDLNSFWFLLPILALFVILFLVPLVQTAYYSFTDFNGYSTNMKFVRFDNKNNIVFCNRAILKSNPLSKNSYKDC